MPGIEIKKGMVYRVGRTSSITRSGGVPMMVILDGAQMDPGYVKDINGDNIAGVELLTSGSNTAIYGNEGYWGVILITTKRGDALNSVSNAQNIANFIPYGYAVTRQFYSPVYDRENQTKMANLRSTIYWNPDIVTDVEGKASITFYNADNAGTCKVTLEGMDLKGKLVRKVITYAIK